MTLNVDIVFTTQRCWDCGRWWAHENARQIAKCPYCAMTKIQKFYDDLKIAEKTISNLKGQITKLKKK